MTPPAARRNARRPRRRVRGREPIRVLLTDVDGTLTDERRRLDVTAMRAIRALDRSGVHVVLATGNVLPAALAIHRSLGLTGPIVAENGGLLYYRDAGEDVVVPLADRRPALAAYRRLRAAGVPAMRLFSDRWRETEVALEPTVALAALRPHLAGLGVIAESTGYAIHLMAAGGGKMVGVRRALDRLGLPLAACLATGDGDNDVPMLRSAGVSVSFANGSPRARRAADFVTRRAYAAGFVEALKRTGVLGR